MEKERFAPSAESVVRRGDPTNTMTFDHDQGTRGHPTATTTGNAHSVAVVYHDCFTFESPSSFSALIAPAEGSRGLDENTTTRQATTPLLSMIQRCDSYSNFYDALSDPRLSSSSSSAATRLLLLLQLQQLQHYQQHATIPTDSSTITTSSSSTTERMVEQEQQQQHRRRDVLLGYSLLIATSLATAVLNAAITIFGMGVGVGLILGDTMRDFPSTTRTTSTNTTATATTTTTPANSNVSSLSSSDNDEGEDVQVYPSTPTCRATVQRISNRSSQVALPTIQQQPQYQRLSTMPAQ